MAAKRVLSLGNCGADHGSLSALLQGRFRAEVVPVDAPEAALAELRNGGYDLVLVNRVFFYTGGSGLEFIRQVKQDEALQNLPVMLISNYESAQNEATALGALPGFGKAALRDPETLARLRAVLGAEPSQQEAARSS